MIKHIVALLGICGAALAGPAEIVDGDTLIIDGTTYRLNGIDAPEYGQKCGNWACGKDAVDALAALAEGRDLQCQVLSEDGYGRSIATCFLDGRDLGAAMVEQGLAWAFVRYSDAYVADESEAQSARLGIWSGDYQPPWEYRKERWDTASQQAPEGCPIKGNISRNGQIYHPPWSPWYSRTRINTSKGERWFCSEAEAVAAGWRAPRWR